MNHTLSNIAKIQIVCSQKEVFIVLMIVKLLADLHIC